MKSLFVAFSLLLFVSSASDFDLTVVSYNVESDADTKASNVARDLKRIPPSHIWGLSEVYERDFETYRKAIGDRFKIIKGCTGRSDRLAIIYDPNVLEQVGKKDEPDTRGTRDPLIARFKVKNSQREFLFIVNHLQRGTGRTNKRRQAQAQWLNAWAKQRTEMEDPPAIILVGDYNFDVDPYTKKGNPAYAIFMRNGVFRWVEPPCIADSNCPPTGTGCNPRYNSILDFVFLAGPARRWKANSEILFKEEDYCTNEGTAECPGGSDHRPIRAVLTF